MPKRKPETSVVYFDLDELEREASTADVDTCLANGRQVRRCVDFFASAETDGQAVDNEQDRSTLNNAEADIAAYVAELEGLVDAEMSVDNAAGDHGGTIHSMQTFASTVSLSHGAGT